MTLTVEMNVKRKMEEEGQNLSSTNFQCDLKSPYLVKMMSEVNNNNGTINCYCAGSKECQGIPKDHC